LTSKLPTQHTENANTIYDHRQRESNGAGLSKSLGGIRYGREFKKKSGTGVSFRFFFGSVFVRVASEGGHPIDLFVAMSLEGGMHLIA
tara:strand:+ start:2887 stop:3150 length:264 start_codon:yes stop_codon:yes gene_type:complete